jgi:predicted nucleotidyltransferase
VVKKRFEIKKIIARYITELERLGVDVSAVFLYGSYAKGKAKDYSDIDIAVVSPSFKKMDIFERQEVLSKAHHNFGEPIEPIGLTPEQVAGKKGFASEILENGIIVYSRNK